MGFVYGDDEIYPLWSEALDRLPELPFHPDREVIGNHAKLGKDEIIKGTFSEVSV